ncbi:Glucooligosaccharide oxidase [Hypoxylon argillaceum]|nr:Glucooligosaccharide oxidase [Hypoxylon argillaceum]
MDSPISRSLKLQGIEVKTPLDPDWEFYSSTYNLRVPAIPEVVALPKTIEHVSQAVCCAAACGLKVQARSGGHSYASHSNGGVDGSVVIDLRKLQDVSLEADGIVRVGGGVRLGRLAKVIFEQGGRALAHGLCPAVGVGGHFTHGGFGLTSRAWGLSMDQISAVDVVMADGRVVTASESVNKDVFVAIRGAADSFGIVVNFYLRTQPAPKNVVKWSIDVPQAVWSIGNAVDAFLRLQDFANNASTVDRKLGFVVFLSHNRFTVEGTYLGDIDTFNSNMLPALLRVFPQKGAIEVDFRQVDWPTLLRLLAGTDLEVSPNYAEHHVFLAKSAAVVHPGLSKNALEGYFKYLLRERASAPIGYFVGIQLYGGADSQITANTADDSYGHRDAMWMFQQYGFVDDKAEFPDEGVEFMQGLNDALGPGHGASNNYADASLVSGEAQRLYYGEKLAGLMKLKSVLDPDDVFSHPQSVRRE